MTTTTVETDPTGLTKLIAQVQSAHEDQGDLLIEHLESARIYLVGSMPEEGAFSLELADDVADGMRDQSLRHQVREQLQNLLLEVRPHR